MNTIASNLAAGDNQSVLSRSLSDLAARTRASKASDSGSSSGTAAVSADQYTGPALEIAQQNRYAALTDPESASAVNASLVAALGLQPQTALGVQANVSGSDAWGLIQLD